MKKSIALKYAWEKDENFNIAIVDGTSQREIEGRDTESLPQGLLQELRGNSYLNQSFVSLEGVFDAQFLKKAEDLCRFGKQQGYHLVSCFMQACRRSLIPSIFLQKMKESINLEFEKREVGHATFQVRKQVEQMVASFEDNVITKLDSLVGDGKEKD